MKCEYSAFQNKIIATLALLFATVQSLASESSLTNLIQRELTVEIEAVTGASSYQVKISPTGRTKTKETIHTFKDTKVSILLGLGTYSVLSRSLDSRGVGGPWADLGNVTIAFPAPKIKLPEPNAEYKITDEKTASIKFTWDSFHQSAQYFVEILDSDKNSIMSQTVTGSTWTTKIPPGNYLFKLKSLAPTDSPLEGIDPDAVPFSVKLKQLSDPIIVKPKKLPLQEVSWKEVNQATTYLVKIEQISDQQSKNLTPAKQILSEKLGENTFKIPDKLSEGTYKFSVRAEAEGFASSRTKSLVWKVKALRKSSDPSTKAAKLKAGEIAQNTSRERFLAHVEGDIGPVIWSYQFNAEGANNSFSLMALTSSAVAIDALFWPIKQDTSGLGFEIYGRQTTIKLFEDGNSSNADQEPVSVGDRRVGGMLRYRKSYTSSDFDLLCGLGLHRYTYLIQDSSQKVIASEVGTFSEYTLGGAYASYFESGNFVTFELKLHPVKSSEIILINNSRQYSASLKFSQSIIKDRAFLTYKIENLRTSLDVSSPRFTGSANVISSWYRLGLGLYFQL